MNKHVALVEIALEIGKRGFLAVEGFHDVLVSKYLFYLAKRRAFADSERAELKKRHGGN